MGKYVGTVARLIAMAALWVRNQKFLKSEKGALARNKYSTVPSPFQFLQEIF
jgi:hypothetical protein